MDVIKFVIPEIIFGRGAISQVGESLARLGARKAFLVTDPGVVRAGWADKAIASIKVSGLSYEVWDQVTPNPKDHEVEQAIRRYRQSGCDSVAAVGGGSPMDLAKAVACLSANDGTIHQYEGVNKISRPLPPMVMVPSTAGSGADVSQFCIITDTQRKLKMVIVSKSLVPDISITDPILLTTKDGDLTAHTGMDALSHAVEAYTSLAATPISDVHALNAIRLISQNLRESVASQSTLGVKEAMAMASLQAGLAFSNALLGALHAMAHQLGGTLDMSHGVVDAVLLPHVMEFNFISSPNRFAEIAAALGEQVAGLTRREAGRRAILAVKELTRDIGIPRSLKEIGVSPESIECLSANAIKDICMVTNPRDASVAEIQEIFWRAMEGRMEDD